MIGRIKTGKVGGISAKAEQGTFAPQKVALYANRLGLGALEGSSGAAGSEYFEFQRGTIRFSNAEKKLARIELKGPDGVGGELPLKIAKAAVRLKLGGYRRNVGAAGSQFWEFAAGTVRWSNVENRLSSVKAKNVWLPPQVVSAAVKHRLGALKQHEVSQGKVRYLFENGSALADKESGKLLEVSASK